MLAKGMGMSAVTAMRTRAEATSGDLAVTALILGIAAVLWFGWGQADPPSGWSLPLNVGTFAAIAVALGAGGVVARFHRGATAMADPRVRRGYGITVGVEVAACGLGAAGLGLAGHSAYIAPWILCASHARRSACGARCCAPVLGKACGPSEGGFRNG